MRRPWSPAAAVVAVVLLLAGACSSASRTAGGPTAYSKAVACAAPVHEQVDPRSTVHLFPGAAEPTYLTDPPTSGPHRLGPPVTGVASTPIPRPSQVAMLESGYVILQYRGLTPADQATLGQLAGSLVTVAPPVGPLPAPVVATAWTWKLTCGSVGDLMALQAFIAAHRGVGFR